MLQWIGLLGLLGLLGLIGLKHRIPANTQGAAIRLGGLLGFIGIAGFWIPPLGACGAFGALGLWNHPIKTIARLAPLGLAGIVGLGLWLVPQITAQGFIV